MRAPKPRNLLGGHYQIIRPLAKGGFGQTYLAQDTHRPGNAECVVKHLKPAMDDSEFLGYAKRLFEREAEILERLGKQHDQIPRLLAYFVEGQEFYLVQDYVDGHPLGQEIRSGQIWDEASILQLLQDVLNVLIYVHQEGVIHRDIKPDNIIRRRADNRLVLVDFGAVKEIRNRQTSYGHTSVTIAVGTPGYMSSEQHQGRPRSNSDIYALGIVAIQALTGLMPNQLEEDSNSGEIIWQPRSLISSELVEIINRMVRYYFRDRYQSAAEVLQDLEPLISQYPEIPPIQPGAASPGIPSRPPTPPARIPAPTVVSLKPSGPARPSAPASAQPNSQPDPEPSVPITAEHSAPAYPDPVQSPPASNPSVAPDPTSTESTHLPATAISPKHPPDQLPPEYSPQYQEGPIAANSQGQAFQPSSSQPSGQPRSAAVSLKPPTRPPVRIARSLASSRIGIGAGVLATLLIIGNSFFSNKMWWKADPPSPRPTATEQQPETDSAGVAADLLRGLPCQEPAIEPLSELTGKPKDYKGAKYYGKTTPTGSIANGRITVVFSNGDRYDGDYKNGKFEGCGTYAYANFGEYIGQLHQSKSNGSGTLAFNNGNRYIGEFQDGKCQGSGTFILADGTVVSGSWKNGEQVNGNLSCDRLEQNP